MLLLLLPHSLLCWSSFYLIHHSNTPISRVFRWISTWYFAVDFSPEVFCTCLSPFNLIHYWSISLSPTRPTIFNFEIFLLLQNAVLERKSLNYCFFFHLLAASCILFQREYLSLPFDIYSSREGSPFVLYYLGFSFVSLNPFSLKFLQERTRWDYFRIFFLHNKHIEHTKKVFLVSMWRFCSLIPGSLFYIYIY